MTTIAGTYPTKGPGDMIQCEYPGCKNAMHQFGYGYCATHYKQAIIWAVAKAQENKEAQIEEGGWTSDGDCIKTP